MSSKKKAHQTIRSHVSVSVGQPASDVPIAADIASAHRAGTSASPSPGVSRISALLHCREAKHRFGAIRNHRAARYCRQAHFSAAQCVKRSGSVPCKSRYKFGFKVNRK
jgi:hypothetical protein